MRTPASSARRTRKKIRTAARSSAEEAPLSPQWRRELQRRVKNLDDPVRYMLVSEFTRRFILYYDVTRDIFAMNNPELGTLFKHRRIAESVKKLLGRGVAVVKFTTKGGKLKRLSPFVGILRRPRSARHSRRMRARGAAFASPRR